MVYKIETPQGWVDHVFETKQDAMDYVMGFLSWGGTPYRIHRMPRAKA